MGKRQWARMTRATYVGEMLDYVHATMDAATPGSIAQIQALKQANTLHAELCEMREAAEGAAAASASLTGDALTEYLEATAREMPDTQLEVFVAEYMDRHGMSVLGVA